ncbi:MAG: hypothetical protein R3C58_03560 [Parvularculaceae bacterium]
MDKPMMLDAQARDETPLLQKTEPDRLALIRKIGEARNSTVIAYLTSIRDGAGTSIYDSDNRILERHLDMARRSGAKNVDIILNTFGGDATMGWSFHSMFRDYFPSARLGVFVPYVAYSAGTQICLGCDEIILGRSSVLGPADVVRASAISGVMDLFNDLDKNNRASLEQKLAFFSAGESATHLGHLYRVWKEDRRVLYNALRSRRSPLAEKENQKIVDYFLNAVGLHGQGIRRNEAVQAGVSFITPVEKSGVEKEIGALFPIYADVMKLFTPLLGRRSGYGDDGASEGETPAVMIESEFETSIAVNSGNHDRDWKPARDAGVAASLRGSHIGSFEWVFSARDIPAETARGKRR